MLIPKSMDKCAKNRSITLDELITKLLKLKDRGFGNYICRVDLDKMSYERSRNQTLGNIVNPIICGKVISISNYEEIDLDNCYPKLVSNETDQSNNLELFEGFIRYDLTFKKSYHFPKLLQGASIDPEWGLNWKGYYRDDGELRSDITINEGEKIEFYLNPQWSGWGYGSPFYEYERPHFFFTKDRKYMYGSAGTETNPNPLSFTDIVDILDGIEDSI